jgi:Ribonuclease H2 non-catalytic subunit (Ylr154p-like)
MSSTDRNLPQNGDRKASGDKGMPGGDSSPDSDDEQPEHIKVMEEHASFDEIVVWGHEALPDASADPYVKSMEEWVEFAGQVG